MHHSNCLSTWLTCSCKGARLATNLFTCMLRTFVGLVCAIIPSEPYPLASFTLADAQNHWIIYRTLNLNISGQKLGSDGLRFGRQHAVSHPRVLGGVEHGEPGGDCPVLHRRRHQDLRQRMLGKILSSCAMRGLHSTEVAFLLFTQQPRV